MRGFGGLWRSRHAAGASVGAGRLVVPGDSEMNQDVITWAADAEDEVTAGRAVLRIVEIGPGPAGAVCGRLLAGLGHDVIRCEPPGGDPARTQPPRCAGGSLAWAALNAGKSSVVISPGEDGPAVIADLLADADVAIMDMPATAANTLLGLTPARLRRDWPALVVAWISGFGLDGEYADLPGDSLLAEAYGGMATMIGEPGESPLALGGEQAAYCSGVTAFLGVMLELMSRDAGAGGDIAEVAMCDVVAYMDWKSDLSFALTGRVPRRSGVDPGDWRLLPASDGWVGCIFQTQHWEALAGLVGAPEMADPALKDEATRVARAAQWWPVVERWVAERRAEEVYQLAQAAGLPFGWVASPSDLARSSQLRGRGFITGDGDDDGHAAGVPAVGSPVHSAGLRWRSGHAPALGERQGPGLAGRRNTEPRLGLPGCGRGTRMPAGQTPAVSDAGAEHAVLPLAGVTVLDFGTITAGAAVTRLLADYGASVLKVEWLDHPDTFRSWKMRADETGRQPLNSPYFPSNNSGKLGVAANLKSDEGRQVVRQLAAHCQVMVENYRVGVTRRLGIDAPALHAVNPDLIYLSLSSQGQTGPEAGNSSYGSTLDLLSGLASVTGYSAGHPLWSSSDVNYPDQLVSLFGAAFVVYALAQGLKGLHLDISQREVVSWTLAPQIADYLASGRDAVPQGNYRPGAVVPRDTYPCRDPDTWIAICCESDRQRAALATCIGAPGLAGRDQGWWEANVSEVSVMVSVWTRGHDRAAAVAALRAAGVPAVPVLDAADRASEPRFADRQVVVSRDGLPVKGLPMLLHGRQVPVGRPSPGLGQDTRAVLSELCGLPASLIEEYEARGIIACGSPAAAPARAVSRAGGGAG